jgi:hypothetical protein
VDLIRLGCEVPRDDIFFSSGGDIPNGQFFVQRILTSLNESALVIAILSHSYMERSFCLGEIGAAQLRRIAQTGDLYTLLVPPATYNDLEAVLHRTQPGQILDPQIIDRLLDRVASGLSRTPDAAARGVERDKFLSRAEPLVGAHEAQELINKKIRLMDLVFDRAMQVGVNYKMKLRVVFRNETGREIVVGKPGWFFEPDEVRLRPDLNSSVQLEVGGGWKLDQWGGENREVKVENNQAFRVWIGLDWDVSDNDFRRRHEMRRVGTLYLPVKTDGYAVDLKTKIWTAEPSGNLASRCQPFFLVCRVRLRAVSRLREAPPGRIGE